MPILLHSQDAQECSRVEQASGTQSERSNQRARDHKDRGLDKERRDRGRDLKCQTLVIFRW